MGHAGAGPAPQRWPVGDRPNEVAMKPLQVLRVATVVQVLLGLARFALPYLGFWLAPFPGS